MMKDDLQCLVLETTKIFDLVKRDDWPPSFIMTFNDEITLSLLHVYMKGLEQGRWFEQQKND